jgi:uncharacterized membrane protein (DUF106 family)
MLLYRVYDGFIPRFYLLLVLIWVWIASSLLCLPAILSQESFLIVDTCSIVKDNVAMVIYISVMTFLLPACLLTPAFIKWSHLEASEDRMEAAKKRFFEADDDDEEVDLETEDKRISRLHLVDREMPTVLFTMGVFNVVAWCPFYAILLAEPFLINAPPQFVSLMVVFIGYAQTMATPLLICILYDRIIAVGTGAVRHVLDLFKRDNGGDSSSSSSSSGRQTPTNTKSSATASPASSRRSLVV